MFPQVLSLCHSKRCSHRADTRQLPCQANDKVILGQPATFQLVIVEYLPVISIRHFGWGLCIPIITWHQSHSGWQWANINQGITGIIQAHTPTKPLHTFTEYSSKGRGNKLPRIRTGARTGLVFNCSSLRLLPGFLFISSYTEWWTGPRSVWIYSWDFLQMKSCTPFNTWFLFFFVTFQFHSAAF